MRNNWESKEAYIHVRFSLCKNVKKFSEIDTINLSFTDASIHRYNHLSSRFTSMDTLTSFLINNFYITFISWSIYFTTTYIDGNGSGSKVRSSNLSLLKRYSETGKHESLMSGYWKDAIFLRSRAAHRKTISTYIA